jgi:hypothetical protein
VATFRTETTTEKRIEMVRLFVALRHLGSPGDVTLRALRELANREKHKFKATLSK